MGDTEEVAGASNLERETPNRAVVADVLVKKDRRA
jgi:hypothetical protein